MSERFVIPERTDAENDLAVARPWWNFTVRFNVAVTQSVPVARAHERELEGVMMRWGLIAPAAEGDVSQAGRACAPSTALGVADEFRSAWLHGQRGILPLAGFYVWQRSPAGHRQPYYVRLVNRRVFGVAVLWERSVSEADDVIESCATVTVPANALLAELAGATYQMPAILPRRDYGDWLHANVSHAQGLLRSYPQTAMVCHPVPPLVNHLEFDDSRLIRRATAAAEAPLKAATPGK
jgi:putative SOS response-associated peptidase YedK